MGHGMPWGAGTEVTGVQGSTKAGAWPPAALVAGSVPHMPRHTAGPHRAPPSLTEAAAPAVEGPRCAAHAHKACGGGGAAAGTSPEGEAVHSGGQGRGGWQAVAAPVRCMHCATLLHAQATAAHVTTCRAPIPAREGEERSQLAPACRVGSQASGGAHGALGTWGAPMWVKTKTSTAEIGDCSTARQGVREGVRQHASHVVVVGEHMAQCTHSPGQPA